MPRDYIPSKDPDLLAWGANYSTLITATPTAYGLTAANATQLATYQTAFATALEAATNPATRGGATILAKDNAKDTLVSYCRKLAMAIQGTLTVTAEQRFALGLTVRDVGPTPIPPPSDPPAIDILSVTGNSVQIRLHEQGQPTRRGRPVNVAGATVFSFVGAAAPTDPADWKFEGNLTRTTTSVSFPTAAPGAKVWITAFWRNAKDQSGPAADPVGTNIAGGSAMAA